MEQIKKKKEKEKSIHKSKNLIDKDSIFHFLFGIGLGFFLGILINEFILAFILGIVLIPLLEYIAHKIIMGYPILISKNALADLTLAVIGLKLILAMFQYF